MKLFNGEYKLEFKKDKNSSFFELQRKDFDGKYKGKKVLSSWETSALLLVLNKIL